MVPLETNYIMHPLCFHNALKISMPCDEVSAGVPMITQITQALCLDSSYITLHKRPLTEIP